jgi:hypothetical protein
MTVRIGSTVPASVPAGNLWLGEAENGRADRISRSDVIRRLPCRGCAAIGRGRPAAQGRTQPGRRRRGGGRGTGCSGTQLAGLSWRGSAGLVVISYVIIQAMVPESVLLVDSIVNDPVPREETYGVPGMPEGPMLVR